MNLIFLIILSFVFSNENYSVTKFNDFPLTYISQNKDCHIMGRGIKFIESGKSYIYYLVSTDCGVTFDTVNSNIYNSNPNYGITSVYSNLTFQDKFIFTSEFNNLYITDDLGKTFDTLKLIGNKDYVDSKFYVSQNDTNLLLYSNYNINENGYPDFDLYYSEDGFKNYQIINFDELKDTFNIIQDISLLNGFINIYTLLFYSKDGTEDFLSELRQYSYNLDSKEYNFKILNNNFENFELIRDGKYSKFLVLNKFYEKLENGRNIYSELFVEYSNNKINILDTIKIKTGLISNTYLVDNELIYIFDFNNLIVYNIENENLGKIEFPFDILSQFECTYYQSHLSTSWINLSGNLMFSTGGNCIIEIDINSILDIKENVNHNNKINIFPNPANSGSNLKFEFNEIVNQIIIMNLNGEIKLMDEVNNKNYNFDSSVLNPGVYFLISKSNNKSIISKFIIM